ncbi:MAG: tetratricopeptide repeat protein [Chloroflexota bacterium]
MRQFKLLGSLSIHDNHSLSPLMKSPRGCALVAYLLINGGWQPRETVAEILWGASTPTQSLGSLRRLLHRVGKLMPEVRVTRKALLFDLLPETDVDLLTLRAGLDSDDLSTLDQALRLYQGGLLESFYVDDAPRFNGWVTIERERLQQQVQDAFRRLCLGYKEGEQWTDGVAAARRWVAINDFDEEAHRVLIELLAADGQITAAQQQYETCRQRLWEELGVEPEESTRALAEQIDQMVVDTPDLIVTQLAVWDGETLPEPAPLPIRSVMPFQRNVDFVGRAPDLHTIAQQILIDDPNTPPVVAVCGMGGMGKTQLAVEFAYRYGRFFAGVYWLNFAQAGNVAQEVAAIGDEHGMGLFEDGDKLTLADQVARVQRAWQSATPRLLIFDNCEDESLLEKWLPVTGGCRVLVTSRRGTWARELRVIMHRLRRLARAESVALLDQLTPAHVLAETLAPIAVELGDLPLALHLAGSFLHRYQRITPQEYLVQLNQSRMLEHPSLQGRGATHSPTNHELNVARTFDFNFARLDAADEVDATALRMLARAACFAPAEPLNRKLLLETLEEDDEDLLAMLLAEDGVVRLVSLGFLQLEKQETLVMHPLLNQFATDVFSTIVETNIETLARADFATAHAAVARVFHAVLFESGRPSTSSWYALDVLPAHFHHLLAIAPDKPDTDVAFLARVLGTHLMHRADFANARVYLNRALAYEKALHGDEHKSVIDVINSLSALALREGLYDEAQARHEQAIAIAKRRGSYDFWGQLYNNLGYLLLLRGNYVQARPNLEKALHYFIEEVGEQHARTAIGFNNLGVALLNLDDFERAEDILNRSLVIRRQELAEDHPFTAVSLQNIGLLHIKLENYGLAQQFLDDALAMRLRSVGNEHPHTARSFDALGELCLAQADYEAALGHFMKALEIQEAVLMTQHPEMASTYKGLAEAHWHLAQPELARPFYEQALAVLEKTAAPNNLDFPLVRERLAELERG